jgi:predicted DsbA family dithiol-disulfide isomerase
LHILLTPIGAASKDAGLTDEELKEIEPALRSRKMEGHVRATIAQMQDAGIHGVPYFIINNAVVLSGAQPVEVFLQAFEQAKDAQPAGAR